jgi:hypothetical protein
MQEMREAFNRERNSGKNQIANLEMKSSINLIKFSIKTSSID